MYISTLTDTGIQICRLINVETDEEFVKRFVIDIEKSEVATARIVES